MKTQNAIVYDGDTYEFVVNEENEFTDCKKCDLRTICKETFEEHDVHLCNVFNNCNKHYFKKIENNGK